MLQTTTKTEETLAIPELLSGEDPTLCGGDPRDRPSEEPYLIRPLRHGFLMSDMISSPTRHTRNDKSENGSKPIKLGIWMKMKDAKLKWTLVDAVDGVERVVGLRRTLHPLLKPRSKKAISLGVEGIYTITNIRLILSHASKTKLLEDDAYSMGFGSRRID
ncbi:hypothetical protein ONZ45_g14689 [Pleurotus djamor]|nr:hypothetical protein ONZ45_g14689 [Pleurotus djamor]